LGIDKFLFVFFPHRLDGLCWRRASWTGKKGYEVVFGSEQDWFLLIEEKERNKVLEVFFFGQISVLFDKFLLLVGFSRLY